MYEKVLTTVKTSESKQKCSNSCKQKPGFNSSGSSSNRILKHKKVAGNQAVQRLKKSGILQAKLKIGQPNDIYEQEADRVAEQVMRISDPILQPERKCLLGKSTSCKRDEEKELRSKMLMKKEGQVPVQDSHVPPIVHEVLQSSGKPLDRVTRDLMESRFGYDFGNVRVHDDSSAAESAQTVSAHAYTVGQHIAFGEGRYSPRTNAGKWLIAHELTHVVQQSQGSVSSMARSMRMDELGNTSKREDDIVSEQVVASNENKRIHVLNTSGKPALQRSQKSPRCSDPSKIPPGLKNLCEVANDSSPSETEVLLFGNNASALTNQQRARVDAFVTNWLATGGNADVRVDGYASNSGSDELNWQLSCDRANMVATELIFPSSGMLHGIPPNRIRTIAHCKTTEFGPEDQNRRVSIYSPQQKPPSPSTSPVCPPTSPAPVTTLSDYIFLVECAEKETGYNPRNMLAMLRQLYYGKGWSSVSQTDKWDNVIPCSPKLGKPEGRLGTNLFEALRNSYEIEGVDVGHVFTGLESMVCPSPEVPFFLGLTAVAMPNEEFATWGGDLGAAVAAMVACPELGSSAVTNENCKISGSHPINYYISLHAPSQDIEGDIDPFVIRANQLGIPCAGSSQHPFTPTRPISQIFSEYYNNPSSSLGIARSNRYLCFLQSIGAVVSGKKITNLPAITGPIANRVFDFATAFYFKIRGIPSDRPQKRMMEYWAKKVTEWFLFYLQSKL